MNCYWQNQKTGGMYTKHYHSMSRKIFSCWQQYAFPGRIPRADKSTVTMWVPTGDLLNMFMSVQGLFPENPQKERWYRKSKRMRLGTLFRKHSLSPCPRFKLQWNNSPVLGLLSIMVFVNIWLHGGFHSKDLGDTVLVDTSSRPGDLLGLPVRDSTDKWSH